MEEEDGESQPSSKDLVKVMDGDLVIGLFDPSALPKSKRSRRGRPRGSTSTKFPPIEEDEYWTLDPTPQPKKEPQTPQVWGCGICCKSFASKSNLQIHATIHTGERYMCETCNKCFTQKCNLKRHEATHSGAKSFSCVQCNRRFTQKANLQRHFGIHTGNRCFSCEECGKTFIQKCNLKKHLERHTEKMTFPFVECVLTEDPLDPP